MARLSASSSSSAWADVVNGNISAPSSTTSPITPTSAWQIEDDVDATLRPVEADDDLPEFEVQEAIDTRAVPMDDSLYPRGSRDLSFIGLQAFALGSVFAACVFGTILAIILDSPWWRLSAFFATLAVFHFLEYYTTARYNTEAVRAESFLLYSNGIHYFIAHTCATLELIVGRLFPEYGDALVHPGMISGGLALIIIGQGVRSFAMAQAGPSFNHIIARERKDTHKLVTHGFYSVFRHPAYFGFFWWAIGTQFLIGNKICVIGYAAALHHFFRGRIIGEHSSLSSILT